MKAIGWAASICGRLAMHNEVWGGVPVKMCEDILNDLVFSGEPGS